MDPIIKAIDYYFTKKNVTFSDKLISSFFENGTSFPLFIETIFDQKIPGIIENPTSKLQIKTNNDSALQFLFKKDKKIKEEDPYFDTEEDQEELLGLILTKQCFKASKFSISMNCDHVTNTISGLSCIFTIPYIKKLLHVLTKGLVEIDESEEFDQTFIEDFEIAHVPLVINENSFKIKKYNYQICIQIRIIFDIYPVELFTDFTDDDDDDLFLSEEEELNNSDSKKVTEKTDLNNQEDEPEQKQEEKPKKSKKPKKKKKYEYSYSEERQEDEILDEVLLKLINIIGEKGNFQFKSYEEIVKNDSLAKYVMYFFDIKMIPNVLLSKKHELQNFNAIIDFLKKKEKKFSVLLFDFTNSKTVKSSIRSFFVNFFNFFYLKNVNHEIEKRVENFVCMKKQCEENFEKIIALLHLITKKNINVDFENLEINDELINSYFKKLAIPQIISEEINSISDEFFFDPTIYQLKFILNAIDNKYKSVRVAEFFFVALKKFTEIKVPRFDIIVSSFKAKKASLEIQNKRNSNISNVSDKDENNAAPDDKIKGTKKISKPKTYKERIKKLKENSKSEDTNEKIKYQVPEKFWNPPDPNYSTFNGILYDKSKYQHKQLIKEWLVHFKDIQKNIDESDNDEDDNDEDENDNSLQDEINDDFKLYKLFSYDEITNCWLFNSNIFNQLAEDSGIKNNKKIQVPLILYYPSYDNNFTSKLLNFTEIPESEINQSYFIYGVCKKLLSEINSTHDKKLVKPLFLFINIPYSKKNNPQNKIIIPQIFTFLSSICDLEIMEIDCTLNQWQLELMKKMNNIIKEFIKMKNEKNEIVDSKKKDSKSFVGDGDSDLYNKKRKDLYEEEEDRWDKRNDDNENEKIITQYLKKIKLNENPKIIYLVDDISVNYNEKLDSNIKNNNFFQNFVSQIGKENKIHFIKFKKQNTYQNFLNSFTYFLGSCSTTYNEILNNFECIKLFNLSGAYLQIKTDLNSSKTELRNFIHQRFSMLQSNKKKYDSSYDLLFRLKDEINEFFPLLIDSSISNDFNEIYSDLMKDIISADRKIYEHELKKSSSSQLKYLNQSLDEKFYYTDEQLHIIKDSHISFVKQEFFDIIQAINFGKFLDIAYEDNCDILEKQIKKDSQKIEQMFAKFYQRIQTRNTAMEMDVKDGFQRSSNYSMKETENLREIKVAVEIGADLKSVIEQDF